MSNPQKYRKKPVEIEAMRLDGFLPVAEWMAENLYPWLVGDPAFPQSLRYPDQVDDDDSKPDKGIYISADGRAVVIRTLEGDMWAYPGDWIIRGVQGEFYPCKPDIFAATYEQVGDS